MHESSTQAKENREGKVSEEKTGGYGLSQKVNNRICYNDGRWTRKGASPPQPAFPRVIAIEKTRGRGTCIQNVTVLKNWEPMLFILFTLFVKKRCLLSIKQNRLGCGHRRSSRPSGLSQQRFISVLLYVWWGSACELCFRGSLDPRLLGCISAHSSTLGRREERMCWVITAQWLFKAPIGSDHITHSYT